MNISSVVNALVKKVMPNDDLQGEFIGTGLGSGAIPLLGQRGYLRHGGPGSEAESLLDAEDYYSEDQQNEEEDYGDLPEFEVVLNEVKEAIAAGIYPTRIYQGSSGSYFVRDKTNKIVGVFKPKDEEPYGQLNPKWTKWLHKTCCPCLFGRSCLVPNQGYLSEVGASIVDRCLGLAIVPATQVVRLACPTFNYSRGVRWLRSGRLPRKVGSLQLFVNGYESAEDVVQDFDSKSCPVDVKHQFAQQFECLVVLDYVIRNTDRGNDNWLVKVDSREKTTDTGSSTVHSVSIAAIDNGLSFPYKHPESWRTYPYYWAWLPQARVPFSDELRKQILPKVSDEHFVEAMIEELYHTFRRDKGFSKSRFERQAAVLRGQCLNLAKALRERETPCELVQMPPCAIRRRGQTSVQRFRAASPFFSWC